MWVEPLAKRKETPLLDFTEPAFFVSLVFGSFPRDPFIFRNTWNKDGTFDMKSSPWDVNLLCVRLALWAELESGGFIKHYMVMKKTKNSNRLSLSISLSVCLSCLIVFQSRNLEWLPFIITSLIVLLSCRNLEWLPCLLLQVWLSFWAAEILSDYPVYYYKFDCPLELQKSWVITLFIITSLIVL